MGLLLMLPTLFIDLILKIIARPAAAIISYTKMTTWLGDKYEGDYKDGWYHGVGRLQMDNGVVYEGEFVKGHFHGEGKLVYPNVRVWRGREVSTRRGGKRAK